MRLLKAAGNTLRGIRHGLGQDAAIRQVSLLVVVLCVAALCLPVARLERLILILTLLQVALAEYFNSAIEVAIDRISLDYHPLSGLAKDLASVAVGIAVLMCGLAWAVIGLPLLVDWFND